MPAATNVTAEEVSRAKQQILKQRELAATDTAQIGIARSRDGLTAWERHPLNPVIAPSENMWDGDATYKPFAIFGGQRWQLWYNGRRGASEQIGLAVHAGEDLGFS